MKKHISCYLVLFASTIICLNLFIIKAYSAASQTIFIDDTVTELQLGNKIQFLEDKDHKYNLHDITNTDLTNKFTESREMKPSFGFTESAYWVRFTIQSSLTYNKEFLVELDFPLMDSIQFYSPDNNNGYKLKETGYIKKFETRDVKHRNFVFRITAKAKATQTYYTRFENQDRMEFPLTLWSPSAFQEKDHIEQYILGLYYGILFVMFLYHFLLTLIIKRKSYLYYSLFIIAYGFVQLTQNGLGYEFIWPSAFIQFNHHIPASTALCLIAIITFTQAFLDTKSNNIILHKFFLVQKLLFLSSFFLQFILSYSTSIQITLVFTIISLGSVLYAGIDSYKKRYRPATYFLVAWSIFLISAIIYLLKVFDIVNMNDFTHYSMQVGSVLLFILFSFALGDRIKLLEKETEEVNKQLIESFNREAEITTKSREELAEAYRIVSFSERKYKFLVESSNDIIFSLDTKFNIISINNAVREHLKLNQDNLVGTNILDLVYVGHYTGESFGGLVAKQSFQDKLELVIQEKAPIEFTTELNSSVLQEPKLLHLRLEYIQVDEKDEILGKASPVIEDSLLRYFVSERQNLSIANNLFLAEEVTHRLTRSLPKYMQSKEINFLRIALREIIVNAIEHGNLDISFDEKTEAMMHDRYFEFITNLQHQAQNLYKKVQIEYHLTEKRVAYKITDEGNGFDHKKVLCADPEDVNKNMITHGRGVRMASEAFDKIKYNNKGNQVLLVKHFD